MRSEIERIAGARVVGLALRRGRAVLVDWNWICVGNGVQFSVALPWACRLRGMAEP